MKEAVYFYLVILTGLIYFLPSCSTVKTTVADASVPESEQSLIVILNANGYWSEATLVYIDDKLLEITGTMFYIPSGMRSLGFKTSFKWTENTMSDKPGYSREIITTITAGIEFTHNFLPEHTYRIIQKGNDLTIEDITDGGVDWRPPQISRFSPNNGILTNWTRPRGLYAMSVWNIGMSGQYTNLFLGGSDFDQKQEILSIKPLLRTVPALFNMFLQTGLDFGVGKLGFSTVAEINGGVGLGSEPLFFGFNFGYLFLGQIYSYEKFGFGFGYGRANFFEGSNFIPYLRGEVLFFPNVPITIFGDYFYENAGWAVGIRLNFVSKDKNLFPRIMLR